MSYDPATFNPAPGGVTGSVTKLTYGDGRYPVRTTNALAQVQYSAYDPFLGALVQSTGPNGIHTCYAYDSLGYQKSETARCGSTTPLTTTTTRYLVESSGNDSVLRLARTLTVMQAPTGAATGVYANAFGQTVKSFAWAFNGRFTYTTTEYNAQGQVTKAFKPFQGDPLYSTETVYDWLGRVSTVTQHLGPLSIDKWSNPTDTTVTTTYSGSKIQTSQTVDGETRNRYEWKNALGKVAAVEDAAGKQISYTYDADGNLTDTAAPSNNTDTAAPSNNAVHIHYDVLGRKTDTQDPDLGTWKYTYNGFGDLISQTDAKNQTTTMTYDELGRMITKTDATGTAEWVYDKASGAGIGKLAAMIGAPDTKLSGPCSVPNTTQTSGNRAGRSFTYTPFGDVSEVTECADGDTFVTTYDYDELGRQRQVTYPQVNDSRLAVKYHYTSLGYLNYVYDAIDLKPYWVARTMTPAGQVDDEVTRNGVRTLSQWNPSTGWLLSSSMIDWNTSAWIHRQVFAYDEVGNLRSRARFMRHTT